MAEVDTSSYVKPPALPVQKSALDQMKDYQQLQSNSLGINQQRLDQANQALGYMTRAMSSLGPDASKNDYLAVGQNAVKMGLVPPNMLNTYVERLKAAPSARQFYDEFVTAASTHQETINYHLGQPGFVKNGQTVTPSLTSPKFGTRPNGLPIQEQPSSTTELTDTQRFLPDGKPNPNYGSKSLAGPQNPVIPPGTAPVQGGFPGQYQPQQQQLPVRSVPTLPVAPRSDTGTTINQTPNQVVQNRFPTSLPPGVAEASTQVGTASGQALAEARRRQQGFQRDIFPLAQAIPALEKLGTKGTGPGAETINQLKSFVLSNIPGVKESDFGFGTVKDFDKAKKYLTDFVNQTGNSGTNDKLAAAFAGNPSVHISNAAAVDVAKSALALRRMRQSIDLAFEDSGLQADQASKFFANGEIKYKTADGKDKSIRVNQLDPRAFGVDNMKPKAKEYLLKELNGNPREKELFEKSAELAIQHGYLTPR